jgi:hypothetical protein
MENLKMYFLINTTVTEQLCNLKHKNGKLARYNTNSREEHAKYSTFRSSDPSEPYDTSCHLGALYTSYLILFLTSSVSVSNLKTGP